MACPSSVAVLPWALACRVGSESADRAVMMQRWSVMVATSRQQAQPGAPVAAPGGERSGRRYIASSHADHGCRFARRQRRLTELIVGMRAQSDGRPCAQRVVLTLKSIGTVRADLATAIVDLRCSRIVASRFVTASCSRDIVTGRLVMRPTQSDETIRMRAILGLKVRR